MLLMLSFCKLLLARSPRIIIHSVAVAALKLSAAFDARKVISLSLLCQTPVQ